MPAGRPRKPSALKAIAGNPGKRAVNYSEPKPSGIPSPPKHLSPLARNEWRRITRALLATSPELCTVVDRAALAVYCDAWATYTTALEMVSKFNKVLTLPNGTKIELSGDVILTKNGNAIQNPYRSIANRSAEIMLKALSEFGMTPSSRTRLQVSPGKHGPKQNFIKAFLKPEPGERQRQRVN